MAREGTTILKRKIGEIAFSANSEQQFEVKLRPNVIRRLALRMTVVNTIAAGGGNAVPDNPLSLIENIRVESPGLGFKNYDPRMLHFLNKLELGTTPRLDGQLSGAIGNGTYNQEVNMMIPFEAIKAIDPEATVLNTMGFDNITIFVKWKDALDIVTVDNGVAVTCEVMALYREPGATEDRTFVRPSLVDTQKIVTIAGANTEFEVDINEKQIIKTIALMAIDNGIRDNDIINNVKVLGESGDRVLHNLPFKEIQSDNKEHFGNESIDAGFAVFEFDKDGDLDKMLDTLDLNNPKLSFNVNAPTGVSQIYILTRQFVAHT